MRSKLAKPLITSLGTVTMLAASSFVLLAVSSTGSANPLVWTRANPSAALGRYALCSHQGLGAIGCMLSASFHPAAAGAGTGDDHQSQQPLFSVATVADQPSDTPGAKPAAKARSSAASAHKSTGEAEGEHLVVLPPNATMADVLAACKSAMTTAQTRGTAAMAEVETECEADLAPRCPAATRPMTATGVAAIQELEDECRPAPSPSPSPSVAPSPSPTRTPDE